MKIGNEDESKNQPACYQQDTYTTSEPKNQNFDYNKNNNYINESERYDSGNYSLFHHQLQKILNHNIYRLRTGIYKRNFYQTFEF